MKDLIVLGGGPAGITAAIYAFRKGLDTLLLTKDFVGQVGETSIVENYPGLEMVRGLELMNSFRDHIESLGVPIKIGEVVEILDGFTVKTDEGEYRSRALLYALGGEHRQLEISGQVHYCVTCDGLLFRDQRVAVVGGGNSGFEAALELSGYCEHVTILELEQARADDILMKRVLKKDNVDLIEDANVLRVEDELLVYEKDGEQTLNVSGVFSAIGYDPVSGLVEGLVDIEGGYVVIDPLTCETSKEGLFAAGDVTNTPYKQIVLASGQGARAALSAYNYLKS